MPTFALAALALATLALAIVLPPLWRTSRRAALALALALPLSTACLYGLVGTPAALDPIALRPPATPESMDAAIDRLAAQMKQGSQASAAEQTQGWMLLGSSRKAQGRYADARDAFAQANKLTPDTPEIMVEYAEALMRASGERRVDGEALALLQRALSVDPRQQRALWFVGIHHYQNARWAQAVASWEPLLGQVDGDTEALLRRQLDDARGKAGLPPLPASKTSATAGLAVTVTLDPALADRLRPGDTLFVFARQIGGPPMPLAARKLPATSFPTTVTLSDADSPMPTLKLSSQSRVELVARISRSGAAAVGPGDLQAVPQQVDVAAGKASLTISQVTP